MLHRIAKCTSPTIVKDKLDVIMQVASTVLMYQGEQNRKYLTLHEVKKAELKYRTVQQQRKPPPRIEQSVHDEVFEEEKMDTREIRRENSWAQVARKKRPETQRRITERQKQIQQDGQKVTKFVTIIIKDVTKHKVARQKLKKAVELRDVEGPFETIRNIGQGKMIIECRDEGQKDKLIQKLEVRKRCV